MKEDIKKSISKNLNTIDNCISDIEKQIKEYKNKKDNIIKELKDNKINEDNEIINKIKKDNLEYKNNSNFYCILNKCVNVKGNNNE